MVWRSILDMSTWVVYCLATVDGTRTYIGATVDADRRLAQHNGFLKGGARATAGRAGQWYRVCHVRGFLDSHAALSFEWHWKHFTRKSAGVRDATSVMDKRQRALDACLAWAAAEGVTDLEVVWE